METYSAHVFGLLRCSPPEVEDACTFKVFHTGNASESAAKTCRKKVERCRHRNDELAGPTGPALRLQQAEMHVEAAERLVTAAERCSEEQLHLDDVERLLDEATKNIDASDALIEQAAAAEQKAGEARAAAEGAVPAPYVDIALETGALTQSAEHELEASAERLERVSNRVEKRQLSSRARDLRARIQALG